MRKSSVPESKIVASVEIPEGRYFVCDPCWILPHGTYDRLIRNIRGNFPPGTGTGDDGSLVGTRIVPKVPMPRIDYCGFVMETDEGLVASFNTMFGDGTYEEEKTKKDIGVDSGMIGVVPVGMAEIPKDAWWSAKDLPTIEGPAVMTRDTAGTIMAKDGKGKILFRTETGSEEDYQEAMREAESDYEAYKVDWFIEWALRPDMLMHPKEMQNASHLPKLLQKALDRYAESGGERDGGSFLEWFEANGLFMDDDGKPFIWLSKERFVSSPSDPIRPSWDDKPYAWLGRLCGTDGEKSPTIGKIADALVARMPERESPRP